MTQRPAHAHNDSMSAPNACTSTPISAPSTRRARHTVVRNAPVLTVENIPPTPKARRRGPVANPQPRVRP